MDCIVHGVTKSQTRLSDFHFYFRGKNPEVDHILSEFYTMTCPSWVALRSMAHSFIELHKAVIHVIILVSFL